jgi:putative transposase
MARHPRIFAPGLVHHVIARGNRRSEIFLSSRDFLAYLARLRRYGLQRQIVVLAYCLMPNHVHLLIQQAALSPDKFMQGIQQSYTHYFNRTYQTVGHVFQGRYKAFLCQDERYLTTVVRYIHLNPVRAGIVVDPKAYPYCSHGAYLRGRRTNLVDPRFALEVLGGPAAYRELMSYAGETVQDQLESEPEPASARAKRLPALTPGPTHTAAAAAEKLARCLQIDATRLRSADRGHDVCRARSLVAYVLVRQLGYSVVSVAAALGRDANAVSVILFRWARRMETTPELAAKVAALAQSVRV